MAVEVEAAGQVDEFLRVLRRRAWWIIIPFVVIGSLGTFFAVVVPKKYVVYSEVMVNDLSQSTGPEGQNASDMEGRVAPYRIRSNQRIDTVLNNLNWDNYRNVGLAERQEYRFDLMKDLSVKLPSMPNGARKQLVTISFKHTSPTHAYDFLSKLQLSWTEEVLQGSLQRAQKELQETRQLLSELNSAFKANAEVKQRIRNDYEIPSPAPSAVVGQPQVVLPPVFRRQQVVDEEIALLEVSIDSMLEELEYKRGKRDRMPPTVPVEGDEGLDPDLKQIRDIDERIASIEAEIAEHRWTSQANERIRREAKIRDLNAERTQIVQRRSRADVDPSSTKKNPDREALQIEIEDQESLLQQMQTKLVRFQDEKLELKAKAFQMRDALSKLDVLEAESAEILTAREQLVTKATQLEIRVGSLDSPEGNPFEIQTAPTIPTRPTSPNPFAISMGSIFVGLGLGLGLAILKEYSRSCFRSPRELSRVMTHPVLGTVNRIRTRRERARALLVRGVLGGGSMLFALSVGYVTWAWANNRDRLTDSLRDAIESFQTFLM